MADNYTQSVESSIGSSPRTATFGSAVAAGARIVVWAWDGSGTPTSPTVSDNVNGAYTLRGSAVGPDPNNVWVQVAEFINSAAGTPTITWSFGGGGTGYFLAAEVASTDTTNPSTVNGSAQSSPGTGTDAVTSGSVSISAASTLLAMSADTNSITATDEPTVGTGFTARANGTNNAIGAWRLESGAFSSNQAATFTAVTGADTFVTMAVAVPNGGGGGGPTITSTSSATPRNTSLLTLNGSGFEAAQGTGNVTLGGASQVETAWADTAITLRVDIAGHKFGVPLNLAVSTNGGLTSADYALTSVLPEEGTAYVDVGTPAGSGTLTASPPPASGDQCQYEDFGGRVTVFSDLTFSADSTIPQFRFRFFDASDNTWGAWATRTLYTLSGTRAQFDPELLLKGWY